jgi:hypothetical protein
MTSIMAQSMLQCSKVQNRFAVFKSSKKENKGMNQHQLAIIGYGGMGGWHCNSIREKVSQLTVSGIYDIRQEACEKARDNGLFVYTSLEDLLSDTNIDLVTVATPNNFHKDYVISCLCAGKNVVCEKPVTLNAEQLEEIIAVAKETGKLFSIHQNRRWDKDYICKGSSPIVEGLEDFPVCSEQYYLHVDPSIEVLATTHFPIVNYYHISNKPVDMPVAWTKFWGNGRVFYTSFGHHDDVFDQSPTAQVLMERGMLWAADGKRYAKDHHLTMEKFENTAKMY